ncbi:MAG: sterol desaturase family protein [Planctomycetes bacterium]|nr:sterol desaturase family protein [Planctomycetota bacterium]
MSPYFSLTIAFACSLLLLVIERTQAEKGRPWITPNLLTDACVGLIRLVIVSGLLSGFVLSTQWLIHSEIPFLQTGLIDGQPAWLQFIAYFVAVDLTFYVFHRVMHSTKPLWVFHAVHHSARRFNPMTNHRSHPLEEVLYLMSRAIPPAILGGSPPVIIAFLVIDHFWSILVHCDLKVNLGPLKYVFVTPQYHRIHHSIELQHFDKNFAGRLIIWDYLFGTMHSNFHEYPEIGIDGYPVVEESASPMKAMGYAIGHFLYPFRALWAHFAKPAKGHDFVRDEVKPPTEQLFALHANRS